VHSGHLTLDALGRTFTVRLRRFLAQQQDAVGKRLKGRRARTVRAEMGRNVEVLYDVGYWIAEGTRQFPEQVELIHRAVLATAADLAEAVRGFPDPDDAVLLAVIAASVSHYHLPAAEESA
jgi:predicted alpha/beta-hydrolase family hydrolase